MLSGNKPENSYNTELTLMVTAYSDGIAFEKEAGMLIVNPSPSCFHPRLPLFPSMVILAPFYGINPLILTDDGSFSFSSSR